MSPHSKEQAPVTLKNISGEKKKQQQQEQSLGRGGGVGGGGGGENGWKNLVDWKKKKKKTARGKTGRANESHDRCSELLGMCIPKDRWPQVLKALLVVNFFKLHLNAYKALSSG